MEITLLCSINISVFSVLPVSGVGAFLGRGIRQGGSVSIEVQGGLGCKRGGDWVSKRNVGGVEGGNVRYFGDPCGVAHCISSGPDLDVRSQVGIRMRRWAKKTIITQEGSFVCGKGHCEAGCSSGAASSIRMRRSRFNEL